jgi:hypothetical protein
MNYYTNNIRHTKGDTFSCGLVVEDLGQDLDEIKFTCKDNLNDNAEILFQCSLNDGISLVEYDEEKDIRKYAIRVAPEKTKDLQSGVYYYDEEIKVNDDVFTIMKGKFVLEQDSSR